MNLKNKCLALFAVLSFTVCSSQAGFLVEPYLGYKFGSGDFGTSSQTEVSYNAPTMGARLGYQFLGFMAGIDYSMSSFESEYKYTNGSTGTDEHAQTTFGLFAGYELPILLRGWASYYLSSKLEDENGTDIGDERKGSGYALGVGFTGLPFVSLNLEYRTLSYDENFDKSSGNTTTGHNYDVNEVLLSVSLPLDL